LSPACAAVIKSCSAWAAALLVLVFVKIAIYISSSHNFMTAGRTVKRYA
jgi:hypothetical protein